MCEQLLISLRLLKEFLEDDHPLQADLPGCSFCLLNPCRMPEMRHYLVTIADDCINPSTSIEQDVRWMESLRSFLI